MKRSIFGTLVMMEGAFLLLSVIVSLHYKWTAGENDWLPLTVTALLCLAVGATSRFVFKPKKETSRLTRADSFMVVSLSWVVFSLLGMIPFLWILDIDPASAFFETMSGFTTTGATVLSGLDSMPHGLLFWRSMTHWMGGLGIVVFSFALLPTYDMKNSNVFSAEVTGIGLDKLRPKIGSTARRLLIIYFLLTTVCMLFYWAGPMNLFDAACHAMSTIATGGFSTHDRSIAYFESSYLEYTGVVFMLLASVNFSLYYYASIRRAKVMWRNEELRTFLGIWIFAVATFLALFMWAPVPESALATLPEVGEPQLRTALFHTTSVMTSTGFQGQYFDYVAWGDSFWMPTVVIMGIGACAGSTAGGIKVIRILICAKSVVREFVMQLHPRAVRSIKISGMVIPDDRVRRTLAFIFLYLLMTVGGMVVFSILGLDVDTSIGSCVSMLSNVGPGTGLVGPANNFSHVHWFSKLLMSFYMLVGRLEIYTVLFLFMPSFWAERSKAVHNKPLI